MADKKDFKVVNGGKEQATQPKVDFTELLDNKQLETLKSKLQEKGVKVQAFAQSPEFVKLPYAERRLYTELFNVFASGVDCLTALLSVKK